MRKLLLIPLMLLLEVGCQSPKATVSAATSSDFCLIASPFYWSKNDTADTIIQAKKYNAIGVKLCQWKPN